jgi:hypothetical protein
MAMSVTITEEKFGNALQPLNKIKFVWVSAADGTAIGTTTESYTGEIVILVKL